MNEQQQDYQQPNQQWQQQQTQQQTTQPQQPYQYQQQPPVTPQKQSFLSDDLSMGDRVLYCLLGVFVPIIGIICLYFSTQNGYNGIVRDKAKWILIGVAISIIVNIVFSACGVSILPGNFIANYIIDSTHI